MTFKLRQRVLYTVTNIMVTYLGKTPCGKALIELSDGSFMKVDHDDLH